MNLARALQAAALLLLLMAGTCRSSYGVSPEPGGPKHDVVAQPDTRIASPVATKGKALVIGVSTYDSGWDSLRADQDIARVEAALRPYYDVKPLLNASHDDIEEALATLLDESTKAPDAPILVYFAGHGHNIGDVGYIVPRDAPPPSDEASRRVFNRKAIAIETLVIWAKRFPAAQAFFVFDSCFSGSILGAVRSIGDEEPPGDPGHPVRAFLTSGAADQRVPDRSVFLTSFLNGLAGRAEDRPDCAITSDELSKYIDKQFRGPGSTQTPLYGKLGPERFDRNADFVIIPKLVDCTPQIPVSSVAAQPSRPMSAEEARWLIAQSGTTAEEVLEYMRAYPAGAHIIDARIRFKSVAKESWSTYFEAAMNAKARNDWREASALFNAAIALKPEHGGYVRVTGSIRHRYVPFYWLALALQNLGYCDAAKLAAGEAQKKGDLGWSQPADMERIIASRCPASAPAVASRNE